MATWETEKKQSTFETKTALNSAISTRDGNRSGATASTSKSGGGLFGFGGYSVVGLNVSAIDGMRADIRNWVSEIQTHLDGIDPLADAQNAYKSDDGKVENAVKEFVDNVKQYCKNLTSDLLAFSDKLEDVRKAWLDTTGNLAGTITTDTQATDAGSAYQETL